MKAEGSEKLVAQMKVGATHLSQKGFHHAQFSRVFSGLGWLPSGRIGPRPEGSSRGREQKF